MKKMFAALLFMTASHLFADQQVTKEPVLYSGGFMTGAGLTTLSEKTNTVLQLGYYNCWLFDIGVNITANKKFDPFVTFVLGHLGGRCRAYENLFGTYGVMASGSIVSERHHSNQWSVGAFAGLDYQFSKHFMLSGKLYPYNYQHKSGATHNIFANGTVSLFYVF